MSVPWTAVHIGPLSMPAAIYISMRTTDHIQMCYWRISSTVTTGNKTISAAELI